MKSIIIIAFAIISIPLCSFNMTDDGLNAGNLHIKVTGIKNLKGQLGILIFKNEDGFPEDSGKAIKEVLIPIEGEYIDYTFENLPFGEYAVSVMHDENQNDKLDTNFLGIPKEGTGVSNNIKSSMGAPKFKDARFELNEQLITKPIELNY